jgi:hypothetical protein
MTDMSVFLVSIDHHVQHAALDKGSDEIRSFSWQPMRSMAPVSKMT